MKIATNVLQGALHRIACAIVHINIMGLTDTEVTIARELFNAGFIRFDETSQSYKLTEWH